MSDAIPSFVEIGLAALQRAAELARVEAIRTNTGIVVAKDGNIVYITAAELRAQKPSKAP